MAYQDFTTYTKVDTESRLTVAANKVDFTAMELNDISYLQKDFGASYFGDFVHRIKIHVASSNGNPLGGIWSLSSDTNFTYKAKEDNDDGIGVIVQLSGSHFIVAKDFSDDGIDFDGGHAAPFTRYLEIERSGTTFTVKVYSDEYSTLEDTLTLTVPSTAHRYISVPHSIEYAVGDGTNYTGYVENLDINAGAPAAVIDKVGKVDWANIDTIAGVSKASIGVVGKVSTT